MLLILSILIYVLVTNLRDAEGAGKIQVARTRLRLLEGAIEDYQHEFGNAPPSSFVPGQEVPNDGLNVGNEALVVAFWSKKYEAGGLLGDIRDELINSDGDRSTKQLTDFDTRELLEIPDPWGNPIAYIERSDYVLTNRRYSTLEVDSDQPVESVPLAYKNPTTGQYYAANGFQLISAGPDGRFGTEDDVTNFDRQ